MALAIWIIPVGLFTERLFKWDPQKSDAVTWLNVMVELLSCRHRKKGGGNRFPENSERDMGRRPCRPENTA